MRNLILVIALLAGCSSTPESLVIPHRFEYVYGPDYNLNMTVQVIRDKNTGVEYLVYGHAITRLEPK